MPDGAEEAARAAATHLVQQMPRGCDGRDAVRRHPPEGEMGGSGFPEGSGRFFSARRPARLSTLRRAGRRCGCRAGTQPRETDALAAIWKLTDPARFTWERQAEWDGVAVGGTTAASLQGIGDFFASPYRIYAPRRINSRLEAAAFAARAIDAEDASWEQGLPPHQARAHFDRPVPRQRGPLAHRRRLPRYQGHRPGLQAPRQARTSTSPSTSPTCPPARSASSGSSPT